jgi:hypothetical protein
MKHSSYKGGVPVAQRIRKASAGPVPPVAAKSAPAAKPSSQAAAAASKPAPVAAPAPAPAPTSSAVKTPKFKVVHRGEFDLSDTMIASANVVSRRPKASTRPFTFRVELAAFQTQFN